MLAVVAGCAGGSTRASAAGWEDRLAGNAIVLLGEIHDNAAQQRLRMALLPRAIARGWRPAVAMEQFDVDRQGDIDRARRERPKDADHLIAQAVPAASGWNWPQYRPLVQLALDHDLPLIAVNLPRATAARLVGADYASVLGSERTAALGLAAPLAADWQAAQEKAVDDGHCGALPQRVLPGMARAQLARDAVMAELLAKHSERGIVLIAGNGHVRRSIGVPRWLVQAHGVPKDRLWVVGFIETETAPPADPDFDAVVATPAAARSDPCAAFRTVRPPASSASTPPRL